MMKQNDEGWDIIKPIKVYGYPVTSEMICELIKFIIAVPEGGQFEGMQFNNAHLVANWSNRTDSLNLNSGRAIDRLLQRWRRAGLIYASGQRWSLHEGARKKFQATLQLGGSNR